MGKSFKQPGNPFVKNKPKRKGKEAKIENVELTEMIDSPIKLDPPRTNIPSRLQMPPRKPRPTPEEAGQIGRKNKTTKEEYLRNKFKRKKK